MFKNPNEPVEVDEPLIVVLCISIPLLAVTWFSSALLPETITLRHCAITILLI
jgi:hypothetical protein